MRNNRTLIALCALIVAVLGAVYFYMSRSGRMSPQSHPTYSLKLSSGNNYSVSQPVTLEFSIQDQEGKVLKDFDTVHEKNMHLIVVRKDRTNFQHVHPTFNQQTGTFSMESFTFPTDGPYRVFADFTPTNAQKDPLGVKLPATPFQDVEAGDISKYRPTELLQDKLKSTGKGYDIELVGLHHDSADTMPPEYSTGSAVSVIASVTKNGQSFMGLQPYLGALGHMVVLGPNLEFIHAHPQADTGVQTGFILFTVSFPDPGRYKLYLQTQANNQVSTTDFNVTVKSGSGGSGQVDMQPMNHGGH